MKKLLLSLGIVAALAAPAMAQSSYDSSAANIGAGGNSGVVAPGTSNDFTGQGVDTTTTGSISAAPSAPGVTNSGLCDNGAGVDPSSNPQCEFYGANSR